MLDRRGREAVAAVASVSIASAVVDGLRWRYQHHVEPHVVLHRNPSVFLKRVVANRRARAMAAPVAYVYANPTNAGDYASYLGVRRLLGLQGAQFFCDPVAARGTERALKRGARPGAPWSAVVIGGGGLLQTAFDGFWTAVTDMDVPIVLFGVGANQSMPIRNVTGDALLNRIASKAAAIHVRDEFSRELLASRGAQVTVGICPSLSVVVDRARALEQSQTHLLHTVHQTDLQIAGADAGRMRTKLQAAARRLKLEYDEVDHMSGAGDALLQRYARAAVVVSSRLHGAIFAHGMQKPCFAIDCDRKMRAFLDTHAPHTPCIDARHAESAVEAALLAEIVDRFKPASCADALAANQARMRDIQSTLNLG